MFFHKEEESIQTYEIVTQDLLLHLDASDSNSYPGTGTVWYDLSGNGRNASINSVPFTNQFGGEFGGFESGYIGVSHNAILTPSSQITLSSWAYTNEWTYSGSKGYRLITKSTSGGGYGTTIEDGVIKGFVATGQYIWQKPSFTPPPGFSGWHNVSFTYDGTSADLYIDGVSVNSVPATGQIYYNPTYIPILALGRQSGGGYAGSTLESLWPKFPGKIADAMVYSRALTAEELLQNFNATKDRFGL